MSLSKTLFAACIAVLFITSCQKEYSLEQQFSEGTLKDDGSGNCLPFTVNGVFKEDSLLNGTHFVEVQVNLTETGSYIIKSDTTNGYSFSGAGSIDVPGLSTVRLAASGTPLSAGIDNFTINYVTPAGSSSCFMEVTVITVGPPATYTLGATGTSCNGALVSGIYSVGVPVGAGNTASVNVNVTVAGSYTISTPVSNGISFSSSADFVSTGPQTVILTASGTPTTAGVVNFVVSGNSNTCIFPVTIVGATAPAVFTLGGAGGSCTGFTSSGTYAAGTALGASNTVAVNVNVTTIGSYTITTAPINGVTFISNGIFANTGPQLVTLTGSGTPTAAGAVTHIVSAGANTCSFSITYSGSAPQAVYTLSGAPGACTVANVAGTYTAGTPLTSANTVSVQVNVTIVGAYTLTTAAVNGMTFSGTGTFSTTGVQPVVLTGSGTPVAGGTSTFTPQVGTSGCTFNITVSGLGTGDFITCTIDGVSRTFNDQARAGFVTPGSDLLIGGFALPAGQEAFFMEIDRSIQTGGTVTPGVYTMSGSLAGTYDLYAEYVDPAGGLWDASDGRTPPTPLDPFTITILTLTTTRVTGTFSGTVRNNAGTGTQTKIITNGSFSVPLL